MPELAAGFKTLEDGNRDEPRAHHARRGGAANRHPVIGQYGTLLSDPAAKVGGATPRDDVRLAVAGATNQVIIAASAQFYGVPLLSRDARIRSSTVQTIW